MRPLLSHTSSRPCTSSLPMLIHAVGEADAVGLTRSWSVGAVGRRRPGSSDRCARSRSCIAAIRVIVLEGVAKTSLDARSMLSPRTVSAVPWSRCSRVFGEGAQRPRRRCALATRSDRIRAMAVGATMSTAAHELRVSSSSHGRFGCAVRRRLRHPLASATTAKRRTCMARISPWE